MSSMNNYLLILSAIAALATQVAGGPLFARDGGLSLSVDSMPATCGDTTCDEETCLVQVNNLYGCTGEYNGFGASGEVAGPCSNLVQGAGGSVPIGCGDGVSLTFCSSNGQNHVVFKNSGGPSSAILVGDGNGGYGATASSFTTGANDC